MATRTKRTILTFLSSNLKTIGILVVSFVATPVLLNLIGPDRFGAFKVLTEIQSYLGLVEMGLLGGIVANIFSLIQGNDEKELQALLSEGKRSYYRIMVMTLLAGVCLLPFLTRLTSWPYEDKTDLYLTYLCLLGTAILLPTNLYRGYLDAKNQGYVVHMVGLIQSFVFTLIGLTLAYLGWQMRSQGVAFFMSGAIGAFLLYRCSKIHIPLRKANPELQAKIKSHQRPQVLNEVAGKLCFSLDQIVLSIMLGPLAVTKVFLGQRVVQLMQQQIVSFGQSFWASLGAIYFEADCGKERFSVKLVEISKYISLFAIAGLVPICVLNEGFLELWVGKKFMPENAQAIVYVSSLNTYLMGLFSFWGFIFTILGMAQKITRQFYYQALINVTVSVIATHQVGLAGPLIGTLVSFILVPAWYYPHLLERNFSLSKGKILFNTFSPLLVGVLMTILFLKLPIRRTDLTWIEFCVTGASIFFLNVFVIFVVLFDQNEKNQFINKIKFVISKWTSKNEQ